MPDDIRPATWQDIITAEAKKQQVDPRLALAVADVESGTGRNVGPSSAGARGIMQLMPATAAKWKVNIDDPADNIRGGVSELKALLDEHNNDVTMALRRYNASPQAPTSVTDPYVQKVLSKLQPSTQPGQTLSQRAGAMATVARAAQATTPPPKPGFFQGLRETMIPSWDDMKSIGHTLTDVQPGEIPVFGLSPSGMLRTGAGIVKGLAGEHWAQLKEAGSAAKAAVQAPFGSTSQIASGVEAAGHLGAAALPVVGPMAARAGEAIGRGETAYGLGQATGLVAPLAAGEALRSVRATRPIGEIPLTRGERTGSATSKFAETLTEKTIPGRTAFQRFRQRQQQGVIDAAQRAVEQVSTILGTPGEAYGIGSRAQKAVTTAKQEFIAPIQAAYRTIGDLTETQIRRVPKIEDVPSAAGLVDEFGQPVSIPKRIMQKTQVGGLQPETRGLKQFAVPLLRRVREEAQLLPPEQLKPVIESLTRIISAPKQLSYQAFQDARSDLLAIARRHGDPIPGKAGGLAKKLAALTDDAMEQAAEGSGITVPTADGAMPLQKFVRQTNALWAEAEDTFNQSVLAKMAEHAPERMHQLLETATIDDIAKLKKFLPPRQTQQLKAKLLDSWLQQDIQGEPLVPGVKGLPEATAGPSIQGSQFRRRIERFGLDRAAALFGDDELQGVLSIAKTAEQLAKNRGDAAAGLIAGGINASLLSAGPVALAALAWYGDLGSAAVTLGGAAATTMGLKIAAKLMTSPEGLTTMRQYVRAIGQGHLPEATLAAQTLSRLYQEGEQPNAPPRPRTVPSTSTVQSTTPPPQPRAFGTRADGTAKGQGFFGALQRPSGGVSSEISIGVNIDGKEVEIPTLVPTLTESEKQWLLTNDISDPQAIPQTIVDKATAFAKQRIAAGKSPFASDSEAPPQPRTLAGR